jgi:DNA-binding XRE family transcriptional regulator
MNNVNNLQEFREKFNFSRAELTGLSKSGVYRIETGSCVRYNRNIRPKKLCMGFKL